MHTEPQAEHRWLQRLLGEWTFEHEAAAGPDSPPVKFTGAERVRPLGELWVLCEGQGEMPGGESGSMLMALGFDPAKNRFVGTWIGSMMTHLWVYDGELDPDSKTLTLNAEGPSFAGDGTMAKYRDVIEFQSDDRRTLTSHVLTDDGTWRRFMTAHYRRACQGS